MHVVSKFWRTLLDTSLSLVSQSGGDTSTPILIFSLVVLHCQLVMAVVGSLWPNDTSSLLATESKEKVPF
jgi:hypothetical protein